MRPPVKPTPRPGPGRDDPDADLNARHGTLMALFWCVGIPVMVGMLIALLRVTWR
jgi:hypothetical protein